MIFPADYRQKSPQNPPFIHFRRLQNFLLASPVHLLFFWPQTDQFRPYFDNFSMKKHILFDLGRINFSMFRHRFFSIFRYFYSFSAPKRGVQSIPRVVALSLVFFSSQTEKKSSIFDEKFDIIMMFHWKYIKFRRFHSIDLAKSFLMIQFSS